MTARLPIATGMATLRWLDVSVIALLIWLPISTPIAVLAFQYLGVTAQATRVLLLTKDAFAIMLVVALLVRFGRRLEWRWFDLAAVAYFILVVIYTVIPLVFGSPVGLAGVIASARQLAFPVVLYGIGRLAFAAGGSTRWPVTAFIAISVAVAAVTVAEYLLVPVTFFASTYDLVAFVREVQGFASKLSLWNMSLLGTYTGNPSEAFARAVGPFTHPVGAAHYFVLPLAMTFAAAISGLGRQSLIMVVRQFLARHDARLICGLLIAAALFGFVIIFTMSRGVWVATGLSVLIVALAYRRLPIAAVGVTLAVAFVLLVPPFQTAITTALSGADPSTRLHVAAIDQNLQVAIDNPLGAGVGRSDQFGAVDADSPDGGALADNDLGVGENLYLTILVNVGPLGLVAFAAWVAGVLGSLVYQLRARRGWVVVALIAATIPYLASAMTSSALMRFTTSGSFWLLLGLLAVGLAPGLAPHSQHDGTAVDIAEDEQA